MYEYKHNEFALGIILRNFVEINKIITSWNRKISNLMHSGDEAIFVKINKILLNQSSNL